MEQTQRVKPERELIQAWIPARDWQVLRTIADREGTTMSEIVRRQVRAVVTAYETIQGKAS